MQTVKGLQAWGTKCQLDRARKEPGQTSYGGAIYSSITIQVKQHLFFEELLGSSRMENTCLSPEPLWF